MAVFVHPTTIDLAENQPAPWLAVPLNAAAIPTLQAKYPGRCAKLTEASGHLIYVPQIQAVARQYRKWVTDHVEEMSAGEKATVDAAAATALEASKVTGFDSSSPMGVPRPIIKPTITTRTGTTTLTNDPHLSFSVVPGGRYVFEFRIFFDTTATADFKFALNGPASPNAVRFERCAIVPGASAYSGVGVSTAFNGGGTAITGTGTTGGCVKGTGVVDIGPNGGTVAVQWAQNTSDPGNTSVLPGSMLWFTRIG